MNKRKTNILFIFLAIICFVFGYLISIYFAAKVNKEEATYEFKEIVANSVKSMKFKDLKGEEVVLGDFIPKGKPIILNIWATWCPPCIKELPSLHELSLNGKYHVVTVATDRTAEAVEEYLKKNNFDYLLVLWDKNGTETRRILGAKQLPTTFILNENFEIKGIEKGERIWNHKDMLKKIETLLK